MSFIDICWFLILFALNFTYIFCWNRIPNLILLIQCRGFWPRKMHMHNGREEREPAVFQYIEWPIIFDSVDDFLGSIGMQWSTDEADWSVEDVRSSRIRKRMHVCKWSEVERTGSIQRNVNVLHTNFKIDLFICGVQLQQQRFYINQFFRVDGEEPP